MHYEGSTTDDYVVLHHMTSRTGIHEVGSIKNTGGLNSMTVRYTVTNVHGGSERVTTEVVIAGNRATFDTIVGNVLGTPPPYATFMLEVKSTLSGFATDFELVMSC